MSPEAAAAQASEETLKQLAAKAALKKRQTMLQVKAQERAKNDLASYQGGVSYAAVRAMMDDDVRAPYPSAVPQAEVIAFQVQRSEEHAPELQSLMRTSDAVFGLQKKTLLNH